MNTRATLVHCTPLDFKKARVEGLVRLPFEKGLFKGVGTLESPVIEADFPFDNLVASWNAQAQKGAAIQMDIQVRVNGNWSAWYGMGRWDDSGGRSLGSQKDALGLVDIDTLKLQHKADALRYRMRSTGTENHVPTLHRVAVAYADSTIATRWQGESRVPARPYRQYSSRWRRELKVRPRSQMEEQEKFKHDICSPTSLAMILDFWGKKLSTMKVATLAQDRASQLYGNWTINVAAIAALGLRGHVARLSDLEQLQQEIAAGRPPIVSIAFETGELTDAPIPKTNGHLLVVSGFTETGDVIVCDPAAPDRKSVRRIYRRAEFAKAWLGNKLGLAYILGPELPTRFTVAVPVVELRRHPKIPKSPSPHDPDRLSQLLYGEPVKAIEIRNDWVRIQALEQSHFDGKHWKGYEGWIPSDVISGQDLVFTPNAVVKSKRATLNMQNSTEEEMIVSMGTKLCVESISGSQCRIHLVGGRKAMAHLLDLNILDEDFTPSLSGLIQAAEQFAGDAYVWGGRSSQDPAHGCGVDCSGLIGLSYRTQGIDLPRDAHDQFLQAHPLHRSGLRPGDLVFLSQPGAPKKIDHVLLYADGENLVESRQSKNGGLTVKTTFQKRFGKSFSQIESGDIVEADANGKPARRILYFGSYLHV